MLQKQENWQKNSGELKVIHQICQTFTATSFLSYGITINCGFKNLTKYC